MRVGCDNVHPVCTLREFDEVAVFAWTLRDVDACFHFNFLLLVDRISRVQTDPVQVWAWLDEVVVDKTCRCRFIFGDVTSRTVHAFAARFVCRVPFDGKRSTCERVAWFHVRLA